MRRRLVEQVVLLAGIACAALATVAAVAGVLAFLDERLGHHPHPTSETRQIHSGWLLLAAVILFACSGALRYWYRKTFTK